MKIFPDKIYAVELNNDSESALLELKNKTLSKEQFVANWNNQTFIGIVTKNEFEINLSENIIGEFCVVKGKFENKKGTIEINICKVFKIIFVIIVLFSFFGVIESIIQNKLESLKIIVLNIFIMRFGILEFLLRFYSKKALKKLTGIIGINYLKIC